MAVSSSDVGNVSLTDISDAISEQLDCEPKHTYAVLKILTEEILKEIVSGNPINIDGFGEFKFKRMKAVERDVIGSGGVKKPQAPKTIRFRLAKKLKWFLIENLAKDKTFGIVDSAAGSD